MQKKLECKYKNMKPSKKTVARAAKIGRKREREASGEHRTPGEHEDGVKIKREGMTGLKNPVFNPVPVGSTDANLFSFEHLRSSPPDPPSSSVDSFLSPSFPPPSFSVPSLNLGSVHLHHIVPHQPEKKKTKNKKTKNKKTKKNSGKGNDDEEVNGDEEEEDDDEEEDEEEDDEEEEEAEDGIEAELDAKNDKKREKVRELEGKKGSIKAPTSSGQSFKLATVDVVKFVTEDHPGVEHQLQADEHVEVRWPVLAKGRAKENKDWDFTSGQNLMVSKDGKKLFKCVSEVISDTSGEDGFFVHFSHLFPNN